MIKKSCTTSTVMLRVVLVELDYDVELSVVVSWGELRKMDLWEVEIKTRIRDYETRC